MDKVCQDREIILLLKIQENRILRNTFIAKYPVNHQNYSDLGHVITDNQLGFVCNRITAQKIDSVTGAIVIIAQSKPQAELGVAGQADF